MDMLISFDAHATVNGKESSIEAYSEFYDELGKLCKKIIHPYNETRMPRSTCLLKDILNADIIKFKIELFSAARKHKLKLTKIAILRAEGKDYKFSLLSS
ncbi:hypothetical protein [Leptospira sarikeiensis]|uniref:Uncharacterized protein n=1 Tax=Leptospira sarikeiensis TaxID=2484943 RepID=A0A4R9K6F5_9LEPT|nr:hypothetical protein [Leptospira sarikeiensis]TGL61171.1 hypothetical protein EHQ64_11180 [Leptospira sarikeiensis]